MLTSDSVADPAWIEEKGQGLMIQGGGQGLMIQGGGQGGGGWSILGRWPQTQTFWVPFILSSACPQGNHNL